MTAFKTELPKMEFRPVTPDHWADLEELFGPRGACGGCWCMYWHETRAEYEKKKGEANRRALKRLVTNGPPPGLLAYADGRPIGWCAFAPRETYTTLARSRVLAPVDNAQVWSVPCFFIAREFRRSGLTSKLLAAAAEYARRQGAKALEGYPVEPKKGSMPDAFAFTGLVGAFKKAGFFEAARRSATRPIMRLILK